MKAAFIDKPFSMEFIDAPEPDIKNADDVKIQIKYCGICGSEVHAFCGTHPTRLPPIISGHECTGIVVDKGEDAGEFEIGDRVVIEPQYSCGKCPDCLRGNYNVCPTKAVLGTIYWQGAFGEYVIAPKRALLKLPDSISLEEGALIEPLAVSAHAVRMSQVGLGKTVLILGSGPIGLSLLAMCKMAGASKIIVTDVTEYNLKVAREMGADLTINSHEEDPVKGALDATQGLGADVVFMAVGKNAIMDQAIETVKRYGQIMEVAHFAGPPPFEARKFRWKEVNMQGSYMFVKKDFEIAIRALCDGTVNAKPMISKIVPIEECKEVMEMAHARSEDFVKILFKF